jgi:two-component system, NarL family, nitrate/nitrite response regulator NarL
MWARTQPSDGGGNRRELARRPGSLARTMARVFVVAEVPLYREGIAEIINQDPGMEVVGTAADALGALSEIARTQPHVVLLEASGTQTLEAVQPIKHALPSASVVALAVRDAEADAVACAEAGATGYLTAEQSVDDVVVVVRSVVRGEAICSPRVAGALLRRVAALARDRWFREPPEDLTSRELEIVHLIEQGRSNKEIAQALCIELATVKTHVHRILKKLGVRRRGEAAALMRARRLAP